MCSLQAFLCQNSDKWWSLSYFIFMWIYWFHFYFNNHLQRLIGKINLKDINLNVMAFLPAMQYLPHSICYINHKKIKCICLCCIFYTKRSSFSKHYIYFVEWLHQRCCWEAQWTRVLHKIEFYFLHQKICAKQLRFPCFTRVIHRLTGRH